MKKKYIVILGVLLLSGCGKKTYQDYAGEYYTEDDTEITLRADGSCRLKTWAIKDETGITKKCLPEDGCTAKSDRFLEEVSNCSFTVNTAILTLEYRLNGDYTEDYAVVNNYEILTSREDGTQYVRRGSTSDQVKQEQLEEDKKEEQEQWEEYEEYQEKSIMVLQETITPDYVPYTSEGYYSWRKPVTYCGHQNLDALLKNNLSNTYLVEVYSNQLGEYTLKLTNQQGYQAFIPLEMGSKEYSSSILNLDDAYGVVVYTPDEEYVTDNWNYGFPSNPGEVTNFICTGSFE